MSPELQTLFLAITPFGELRLSIPVALEVFHLSLWSAWFWSVLGNMIPVAILLLVLNPLSVFLTKHFRSVKRCLDWWLEHVRGKFQKKYLRWGILGLVIFVAIPLPMTGAWSGAVAAHLFGIPSRWSFWLILLGVMIAGLIMTGLTRGLFKLF